MISAICSVDENWGIGSNGDLLVHIPEDMKFFKEKTTGSIVIMGRKTYDSLPSKPLPNRTNIVITSKIDNQFEIKGNGVFFMTMDFIKTILGITTKESLVNVYIIGGGQVYKELLPYCDKAYVTKVLNSHENVDTYFPNIDILPEWEVESEGALKEYSGVQYQFYTYKKKEV